MFALQNPRDLSNGIYDSLAPCNFIPGEHQFIYTCTECGGRGVAPGEIVTLYATVSDKNTFGYINVYDKKEEAEKEIRTIVDEELITGVIKGYSFKIN